jgi:hypothetical protein
LNPVPGSLRTAGGEELVRLIHETSAPELLPVLDNPSLDEKALCLLLQRKDVSTEFLQEVLLRRQFLKSYQVKKAIALHPHTPRTDGFRLLRELYLMDLVQFATSPGTPPDLKIKAEEQVINKLPHLPLGQKITLARRAPARLAGALLGEGQKQVVAAVLANRNLNEAQVLRVLSREKLPPIVVQSIAQHEKWSHVYNVRIALIRQPSTTLTTILAFLPELTISDLRELVAPGILPENLRHYLQAEIQRRMRNSQRQAGQLPDEKRPDADRPDANAGTKNPDKEDPDARARNLPESGPSEPQ